MLLFPVGSGAFCQCFRVWRICYLHFHTLRAKSEGYANTDEVNGRRLV